MNMDGFLLKTLTVDLAKTLVDQRIDKVHQPTSQHITMHIGKRRLSVSVAPQETYVVLDGPKFANPLTPPFFCLMLRKHLTNSRIIEVDMPHFERIIDFTCSGRDELGEATTFTLVAELTGRHSNVLLINGDGVIIDALRRVPLGDGVRPVFPGLRYERPPEQSKLSPGNLTAGALAALGSGLSGNLPEFLSTNVQGLSMLLAREIAHRTAPGLDVSEVTNAAWVQITSLILQLAEHASSGRVTSLYMSGKGAKQQLHILPLHHMGPHTMAEGVNDAISAALCSQEAGRQELQLSRKLYQVTSSQFKKARRLVAALEEDLASTRNKDTHKRYGELLYANLGSYELQGGVALVTDYYDDALASVPVPVDQNRSMAENAKRYFRQYDKAVGKEKHSLSRLEEARMHLAYLEGLNSAIDQAEDIETLREIEQEMDGQGLLTLRKARIVQKGKYKSPDATHTRPREYISPDGVRILVGRNNLQNERLVKGAKPDDLWFHVQKAPGSHAVAESRSPMPATTIEFAATLAAYFSSLRDSTLVPVDYTEKKHVRRPAGAKPGFVIYEKQRTVVINMAEAQIPEKT